MDACETENSTLVILWKNKLVWMMKACLSISSRVTFPSPLMSITSISCSHEATLICTAMNYWAIPKNTGILFEAVMFLKNWNEAAKVEASRGKKSQDRSEHDVSINSNCRGMERCWCITFERKSGPLPVNKSLRSFKVKPAPSSSTPCCSTKKLTPLSKYKWIVLLLEIAENIHWGG